MLIIDGVEISTTRGHYGAVGLTASPYPLGGEAREVAEDVERLGGFDTGYLNSFEDVDLCMRVAELGLESHYCANSVVVHHESVTRKGRRRQDRQNAVRFHAHWRSRLVPDDLREASYALGTPKWKVISSITLKAARSGVITGVLLALARIAGETAPLLFTALSNQFFTANLAEPMASLPVTIFKFAMSPYENWQKLAWAGVFLITLGVLVLNIIARVFFREKN